MKKLVLFLNCLIYFFLSLAYASDGPAVAIIAPSFTSALIVGKTYSYTYQLTGLRTLPNSVSLTITPNNSPSVISIAYPNCRFVPAKNQSCSFTVTITPTTPGTLNDSINVKLNARNIFNPAASPVNLTVLSDTAYIANYAGNSISSCSIGSNGLFTTSCLNTTGFTFNSPTAIALNPANSFAYIASDVNTNIIYQCVINPSGIITNQCSSTGNNLARPYSIVFNAQGTRAYLANNANGTVSVCRVNDNNSLSCDDSGVGAIFTSPYAAVLNRDETFAYVANTNGILKCEVNSDNGSLSSCVNPVEGGFTFTLPTSITFNRAGSYAYITDFHNDKVVKCSVDADNGNLSHCANTSLTSVFRGPTGISLNLAGTNAYITNFSDGDYGSVSVCPVSPTGELLACTVNSSSFNDPFGIFVW